MRPASPTTPPDPASACAADAVLAFVRGHDLVAFGPDTAIDAARLTLAALTASGHADETRADNSQARRRPGLVAGAAQGACLQARITGFAELPAARAETWLTGQASARLPASHRRLLDEVSAVFSPAFVPAQDPECWQSPSSREAAGIAALVWRLRSAGGVDALVARRTAAARHHAGSGGHLSNHTGAALSRVADWLTRDPEVTRAQGQRTLFATVRAARKLALSAPPARAMGEPEVEP
jgi:hypothetical protein